jgi:hypothetical protein
MAIPKETLPVTPPKLITSCKSGFDTVANNLGLILLPLLLDLFLWLGPHLSLKAFLQPFIVEINHMPGMDTTDMANLANLSQQTWQYIADHLNLAVILRSYPLGVPSLMASQLPVDTPFGKPMIVELTSFLGISLWLFIFAILGLALASFYFNAIARAVLRPGSADSVRNFAWLFGQVILFTIVSIGMVAILSLPVLFVITFLALFSAVLAQIAILFVLLFALWFLLPLAFSPHGIFVLHQNAFTAMLTSARLVRFILPGFMIFILVLGILSQGLDLLWETPPATSWMTLVGIAGHAFVTTGLLAATFVYYRDGLRWAQEVLQRKQSQQKPA